MIVNILLFVLAMVVLSLAIIGGFVVVIWIKMSLTDESPEEMVTVLEIDFPIAKPKKKKNKD